MFNRQNFCHIASNNRNDVKAGVFVYKTTDVLETVSANGYFNDQIIDINLHDLIIHEWHNPNDRTDVQYNLLCVVERTLDNVGTVVIKSNWQSSIEDIVNNLDDIYVKKAGDTMTGTLRFGDYGFISQLFGPDTGTGLQLGYNSGGSFPLISIINVTTKGVAPSNPNTNRTLGKQNYLWKSVYAKNLNNNGYDIEIPTTTQPDTLALKSELNAIANAGGMITSKGVWYAKMDPNSTVPASAEVEGRNYADFTQVDGGGNPIIVIYEYTNGAWAVTDTITPPAATDGYVLITSKIWDIPEQTGQQGGRIYWNHTDQTFTPFPTIISFDGANITNSTLTGCTATMSPTPSTNDVASVGYVQSVVSASAGFEIFDIKWRDGLSSSVAWALSDGNWKTNVAAYQHLVDDFTALGVTAWNAIIVNVGNWWRYSSEDKIGEAHPYAFADEEYNLVYCDTETPAVGVDELYNNYTSAATSLGVLTDGGDYDTVYWPSYETIAGTTVAYFRAQDGHKIVIRGYYDEGKNAVDAIYAATGVAWYYVLDTSNQQFILPRTQFGFVGERAAVGDYVAPELPNIKGSVTKITSKGQPASSGALYSSGFTYNNLDNTSGNDDGNSKINIDASLYDSVYKDNGKVQPPATQMYLYFYVGI